MWTKTKWTRALLCVCVSVFVLAGMVNAEIIVPTIVSETNTNVYSTAITSNLNDNSGLTPAVNTGDSLAAALAAIHANTGVFESWVTNAAAPDYFATSPAPVIVWDLTGGGDMRVGSIVLWQYQNDGGGDNRVGNHARTIELRFNTEAEGSATFNGSATTTTMVATLTGEDNVAQDFDLLGQTCRYVQMTVTDNHYGDPDGLGVNATIGGDRVGLGEVRFAGVQNAAHNPDPSDGSNVGPEYYEDNVYMVLDYTPGLGAITHTAYFSDVKQDVIDRDEGHSLGSIPPWSAVSPTAFVVGYDDPGIPEFARTPLVGGTTYYWCIDEFDGTDTWLGKVWSFTVVPKQAWGPSPYDGEELVLTNGIMTWNLGSLDPTDFTLGYDIYIGADEAAVASVATNSTASPLYAGSVPAESYDYADLEPEQGHFWRVDTTLALTRPPFTVTITKGDVWGFTTASDGAGNILREVWTGIPGTAVSLLTSDPRYPDNPDTSELLPLFEGPTGDGDEYGSRLHGWLIVSQTGDYTFWIATDDNGELWLSTDANPANAVLISWVGDFEGNGWAGPRAFDDSDVTPSEPIHLESGQQYYIAGLIKEGTGGDNIAVAWQGPDTGDIREVIPGNHLRPYVPVTAKNPDPAHESVDTPRDVTLTWDTGIDESTDGPYTTQHVYIGNDPVAVASATTASPEYKGAMTDSNEFGPLSLSYFEQIYWRVDGVEAGSGTVVWQGAVWTFRTFIDPALATNPAPADGETDVNGNATLSWTPGAGATAHTIYLGADDPANMVPVAGPQASATYYPPGTLELGTTYYWQVVESPGMGEGLTWEFTTSEYRVVDDMESYTPWTTTGNDIFVAWRDGEGDCTVGNGNGTGSTMTENPSPVLGGIQSMKYDFDNDGMAYSPCSLDQKSRLYLYSKIEAQVDTLVSGVGTDWTVGGVKALSLPFHGQLGNATTESLWVQLQDGDKGYGDKVFYGDFEGESLDDFNEASWHEWNIDLDDLNVDLTDVVSIVIGIGNEGSAVPGGSGTLFFDEMRLYVPRCVPARSSAAFALADYAPAGVPDCMIGYPELEVMADDWLARDRLAPPLIGWYKFDGDASDSSGYGNHGTEAGDPTYMTGHLGQSLDFNSVGVNDEVEVPYNPALNPADTFTVAAWINLTPGGTGHRAVISCRDDFPARGYILYVVPDGSPSLWTGYGNANAWYSATGPVINEGQWVHVAGTYDNGTLTLYVDGAMQAEAAAPTFGANTAQELLIGAGSNEGPTHDYYFHGQIDDARIYDRALSQAEIASIMDGTLGSVSEYHPLRSLAELDVTELQGFRAVNFKDFAALTSRWLDKEVWP